MYQGSLYHLAIQLAKDNQKLSCLKLLINKFSHDIELLQKVIVTDLLLLESDFFKTNLKIKLGRVQKIKCKKENILEKINNPNNAFKYLKDSLFLWQDELEPTLRSFLVCKNESYNVTSFEEFPIPADFKIKHLFSDSIIKDFFSINSNYFKQQVSLHRKSRVLSNDEITEYLEQIKLRVNLYLAAIKTIEENLQQPSEKDILLKMSALLDSNSLGLENGHNWVNHMVLDKILNILEEKLSAQELTLQSFEIFETSIQSWLYEASINNLLTSAYMAIRTKYMVKNFIENNDYPKSINTLKDIAHYSKGQKKEILSLFSDEVLLALPYPLIIELQSVINSSVFKEIEEHLIIDKLSYYKQFYNLFFSQSYDACEIFINQDQVKNAITIEALKSAYPYEVFKRCKLAISEYKGKIQANSELSFDFKNVIATLEDDLSIMRNFLSMYIKFKDDPSISEWYTQTSKLLLNYLIKVSQFFLNDESNVEENAYFLKVTGEANIEKILDRYFTLLSYDDIFNEGQKVTVEALASMLSKRNQISEIQQPLKQNNDSSQPSMRNASSAFFVPEKAIINNNQGLNNNHVHAPQPQPSIVNNIFGKFKQAFSTPVRVETAAQYFEKNMM